MKRWAPLLLLLVIALLFVILNRGAYKGYFQDDEFDNIMTTRNVTPVLWVKLFATPRFSEDNFRPAGHIYFFLMNRLAGLNFPAYVAVIHLLHLLNALLLWLFLRKLRINPWAAAAGMAFFVLSVSAFDAYWKPMYVFDLLCATFCLTALLLYSSGHWIAALPAMWLAYKSKELAVMLPIALLAYEYWLGERRYKRLIPFFLISLCFGIQAMLSPQPKDSDYAFVFSLEAFLRTLQFYSSRLFIFPYAGLVLLALPLVVRDGRLWLGAVMLAAFFAPLMFLPHRLFMAYTYVPLLGAAVELAVLATVVPPAAAIAFFLLWLPWNLWELRSDRRILLTADDQVRGYAGGLIAYARTHPVPPLLVLSSRPESFQVWGVRAALNYPSGSVKEVQMIGEEEAAKLPRNTPMTFVNWDRQHNRVTFLDRDTHSTNSASYIKMGADTPIWQLLSGWYGLDTYFRWTGPLATARLAWPADATQFEMVINMGQAVLQKNRYAEIRPRINGRDLPAQRLERPGIQKVVWNLPPRDQPEALVELTVQPTSYFPPDTRLLGVPVVSFGFIR